MNAQNDNSQELSREDKTILEWINHHFEFLTETYDFVYAGHSYGRTVFFDSPSMRIEIQVGRKSPSVFIYKVGEPETTRLVLERIMQYFGDQFPEIYFPDHSVEHNIRFTATILKQYAPKIIASIDDWWIPVHLFQYKLLEKEYQTANQREDFLFSFKDDHEYLKSKGAI